MIILITPYEFEQLCVISGQYNATEEHDYDDFLVECGVPIENLDECEEAMLNVSEKQGLIVYYSNKFWLTYLSDYYVQCETQTHRRKVEEHLDTLFSSHQ